jgi:predicted ArsR family transcriptional regulator
VGIAEKGGITNTTARLVIDKLRADGRVRLVGERKIGNMGRASFIYAVNA